MKIFYALFVAAVIFSGPSYSETSDDNLSSYEGLYAGVKAGGFKANVGDELNFKNAKGILLGFEFKNGLAIEYEHNKADIDWDFMDEINTGSLNFKTHAIYGVYRKYYSNGTFFKAKSGWLSEKISSSYMSADDDGLSYGLGVGSRGDSFSFEMEYTVIEKDIDFFSIGVNVHF